MDFVLLSDWYEFGVVALEVFLALLYALDDPLGLVFRYSVLSGKVFVPPEEDDHVRVCFSVYVACFDIFNFDPTSKCSADLLTKAHILAPVCVHLVPVSQVVFHAFEDFSRLIVSWLACVRPHHETRQFERLFDDFAFDLRILAFLGFLLADL